MRTIDAVFLFVVARPPETQQRKRFSVRLTLRACDVEQCKTAGTVVCRFAPIQFDSLETKRVLILISTSRRHILPTQIMHGVTLCHYTDSIRQYVRINVVDPVASFQLLEHGTRKKIRLVRSSRSTSSTIPFCVFAFHLTDNVRFHSIQIRSQQRQRQHTQRIPFLHTNMPNKFYMHSALGCI